jgi:cephalosporin hydroxylase
MTNLYIDLTAPVQPDQYEFEFTLMLDLYQKKCPWRVLEIGVREGGTLYQWIKYAQKGAVVRAIDKPGAEWGNRIEVNWTLFQLWAADRYVKFEYYLGDSHALETFRWAKDSGPYDFIFIDADHSYKGFAADLLAYHQLVRRGGMVAIHDILPDDSDPSIEIHKYWQELKQHGFRVKELTSYPGQHSRGIGILYV